MRPIIVLADALDAARQLLLADAPLAAMVNGRITIADPASTTSGPWLRLSRMGGSPGNPTVPGAEAALLLLRTFAPPAPQASTLTHSVLRRALGVLNASTGEVVAGATVTAVRTFLGPQWAPDESRPPVYPSWMATVQLTLLTN